LLSLRVKARFLRLQICDQGLNPLNRDLIADRQVYSPVMLDLFVEFGALVTHGNPLQAANRGDPHWMPMGKDGWTGDLFTSLLAN
jgi:hypothetical protein